MSHPSGSTEGSLDIGKPKGKREEDKMSLNGRDLMKQPPPEYNHQSVLTMQKSVTITVTPQRSNSMDLLNFEEKRQLIASSLSLSDILHVSPAAAHVAKEVAASTVIGEFASPKWVEGGGGGFSECG